jgi:hypothetical protein
LHELTSDGASQWHSTRDGALAHLTVTTGIPPGGEYRVAPAT